MNKEGCLRAVVWIALLLMILMALVWVFEYVECDDRRCVYQLQEGG